MGQLVFTKIGHIDEDLMDRTVHQEVGANYFKVQTRWSMKQDLHIDGALVAMAGEVMREDSAPSILAGLGAVSIHGKLNG